MPLTTEQLVELTAYLKKSSEVTVFKLRREIREAIYRLEFLMDYADLPSMLWNRTWPLVRGQASGPWNFCPLVLLENFA